jgi:predicted amidohydrolase YtcJ
VAGLAVPAPLQLAGGGAAALLLVNGRIHTPAGIVQAMAVDAKGVIIALGTTGELDQLPTSGARRIDLEGHAVLPGFHDLHVHPIFAGMQAQRCVIPQGSSLPALQQIVKAWSIHLPFVVERVSTAFRAVPNQGRGCRNPTGCRT